MIRIKHVKGMEAVVDFKDSGTYVAITLNELAGRRGFDIELSSQLDRPTDVSRAGKNASGNTWHIFGLAWDYTLIPQAGIAPPTQKDYEELGDELNDAVGTLYDVITRPHGTGAHIHTELDVKGKLS